MNEQVKAALDRLMAQPEHRMPPFRDAIIAEMCGITESPIAYFYATDLAEEHLTLLGYSKTVMQACQIVNRPSVYRVAETGLWGDAIRERGPVIENDYLNSTRASKRGYPKGHVDLIRHMNLPVFEGDHIVAVVGVGNKATPYTMTDADNLEDLMTAIWREFENALYTAVW